MIQRDLFDSAQDSEIISPRLEMVSFEAFWKEKNYFSFKKFNTYLEENRIESFTRLTQRDKAEEALAELKTLTQAKGIELNFQLAQTANFPSNLLDAKDPIRCFYFLGNLNLLFSKGISIVGSREASEKGKLRAKRLSKELVREGFTVISGLAEGIDTAAHSAAIEEGGTTIGVIGTAITENYPASNKELQNFIAKRHLLLSQVPILHWRKNTPRTNRFFFPERNKTMSALSLATVIIEAGETSGALIQARAAMEQNRKLFILNSCFEKGLRWPDRFLNNPKFAGKVFRVRELDDILENLGSKA